MMIFERCKGLFLLYGIQQRNKTMTGSSVFKNKYREEIQWIIDVDQ